MLQGLNVTNGVQNIWICHTFLHLKIACKTYNTEYRIVLEIVRSQVLADQTLKGKSSFGFFISNESTDQLYFLYNTSQHEGSNTVSKHLKFLE